MPMHDWTRVDAGLYHHFHHRWIDALCDALNGGGLPAGYNCRVESRRKGTEPDDLTTWLRGVTGAVRASPAGSPVYSAATHPPRVRHTSRLSPVLSAALTANRLVVRGPDGECVAILELVTPGDKLTPRLARQSVELIQAGVHLLVVDPFPPGRRDPQGVHSAVWAEFGPDELLAPTAAEPLTAAGYDAVERVAYVEPFAVGTPVPEAPLFLRPGVYVPCPLEAAYQETWRVFPAALKGLLEGG
jgi:hypothetical protein